MLAFLSAQKIFECFKVAYKALHSPANQDKLRRRKLMDLVNFLNEEGGSMVDVCATFAEAGHEIASDMQISILFKVQSCHGIAADQHITYSVDTSSWKKMARDLVVLNKQFEEACRRSYGHPADAPLSLDMKIKYNNMIADIQNRSRQEPKL